MNLVQLKDLTYRYDKRKTDGINHISFDVAENKITSLVGPSGSGKSTTLKCIAKELTSISGEISFQKDYILQKVIAEDIGEIELTVQNYLLRALEEKNISHDQKINQIRSALAELEITNEIESKICELSSGQQQRLLIAKALIFNPTLLLLDEPFANLDNILRKQMLTEIFELLKEQNVTIIWVTHNTDEALAYSDHIVLFNHGEIVQRGKPQELYQKPTSLFTAQFFTETNLIASKVTNITDTELEVILLQAKYKIPRPKNFILREHQDTLLIIHPENIFISDKGLKAEILNKYFMGSKSLLKLKVKNQFLNIEVNSTEVPKSNSCYIDFKNEHIHCLDQI